MLVSDTLAVTPIPESFFAQAQYYDAYANLPYRNLASEQYISSNIALPSCDKNSLSGLDTVRGIH